MDPNTELRTRSISRSTLVAVALMILFSGIAAAGDAGRCYVADVPAEMVLPDGSAHAAGQLKLCVREFSPVTGFHATYVDRRPAGMFLGRIGSAEGSAEDGAPFFVFRRQEAGELVLQGLAIVGEGGLCTYDLTPHGQFEVTSSWELADASRPASTWIAASKT